MKAVEVAVMALLLLGGCHSDPFSVPCLQTDPPSTASQPAIEHGQVQEVAGQYLSWGRASEELEWSAVECFPMPTGKEGGLVHGPLPAAASAPSVGDALISDAAHGSPHAGKLYQLFAKDRRAYVDWITFPQPIGQVIVKQSFHTVEAAPGDRLTAGYDSQGLFRPGTAERDGKLWRSSDPYALFMMIKGDESDPNTDRGWTYATTSFDGKTVYQSGKIDSCMSCHVDAPYDRLFGVPK